jgi:hypothetical protein
VNTGIGLALWTGVWYSEISYEAKEKRAFADMVQAKSLIDRVLDDEAITAGLEDPEARLLVEWLVEQTEHIARSAASPQQAKERVERLCHYARALRQFLVLWCYDKNPGSAAQLAATQKFAWPLPSAEEENALSILQQVLLWHAKNGHVCWIAEGSTSACPKST